MSNHRKPDGNDGNTGTGGDYRPTKHDIHADFNAVLEMISSPEPMPEEIKRLMVNVCHKPVERLIYDVIIDEESSDTLETIIGKGAKLYSVHSKLNEKLERSSYLSRNSRDDFLLNCIVNEIKKRKPEFADISDISDEYLRREIYHKFLNSPTEKDDPIDPDEEFHNFDEYLTDLFKKERNGVIELKSFNTLWSSGLGLHRDYTFADIRPTQNELFVLCFALALDYDVFCRLRNFLKEEYAVRDENKNGPKFRENPRYDDSEREQIMKPYLVNIRTRLHCAWGDVKNTTDFICSKMVENVNTDIEKEMIEQADSARKNPALYPLTVKGKKGSKIACGPPRRAR